MQAEFHIHISLWDFQIRLANRRSAGIQRILAETDGDKAFGERKHTVWYFSHSCRPKKSRKKKQNIKSNSCKDGGKVDGPGLSLGFTRIVRATDVLTDETAVFCLRLITQTAQVLEH